MGKKDCVDIFECAKMGNFRGILFVCFKGGEAFSQFRDYVMLYEWDAGWVKIPSFQYFVHLMNTL